MSTPHIKANAADFAPTVLMPGDPLRARFIAENFLTEVKQVNDVRNMLAFTGLYQGKPVSVMGSGMGMPSIGIYAHELFSEFAVERIIRVGSCGAYTRTLALFDLVLANSAWTESSFASIYSGQKQCIEYPSEALNRDILATAEHKGLAQLQIARVHTTDVFYRHDFNDFRQIYRDYGCVAVDMEAFALFHIAKRLHKQAACLLTVSDCLETGAKASTEEREKAFTSMLELALDVSVQQIAPTSSPTPPLKVI
ncbi:MAG: purine-nucleoside phosphorylase [Idiomarina sp.]|nr:purine-nucleoside phosphorylase [Idiomarina sp.]